MEYIKGCINPRCKREFKTNRNNKIYCTKECCSRARARLYYNSHKDKCSKMSADYRNNNKEKIKKIKRKWHEKNLNYTTDYNKRNKQRIKLFHFNKNQEIRNIVLSRYGKYCNQCEEKREECLTIDHINNDGNTHRKELGGINIYPWLIRNNFPSGFQVLCWNCNLSKSIKLRRYNGNKQTKDYSRSN